MAPPMQALGVRRLQRTVRKAVESKRPKSVPEPGVTVRRMQQHRDMMPLKTRPRIPRGVRVLIDVSDGFNGTKTGSKSAASQRDNDALYSGRAHLGA